MQLPVIPADLTETVARALREDIGSGDITAALIDEATRAEARLITREAAILCGIPWANEVIRQLDPSLQVAWLAADGDRISQGQLLATFSGPARSLLTAERTLLNFLQTLSGTATYAGHLRDLVAHTAVSLLDTRKTLPCLRSAQKYAVRVGGCSNHRMGLFDAFLIKENHIEACGSIAEAVHAARTLDPAKSVEVEVESLEQLHEAIRAGADTVMLDNFGLEQLVQAVQVTAGRVKLEASGGIDEAVLVRIAETGVDFISVGALTKHCRAVDLSLRFT